MNCSHLQIVEIENKYIRNDVRQIYTYVYINRKISIEFTCVGLASAHPNNQNCSQKRRRYTFVLLITNCMRAEVKEDEKLLIDLEWP